MTAREFFRTREGRLRAGWRLAIFFLLFSLLAAVTGMILSLPLKGLGALTGIEEAHAIVAATIGGILAHVVMLKAIDPAPWSYSWLDRDAAKPRTLVIGTLFGGVPIATVSLILLAAGWLRVESNQPGSWLGAAAGVTLIIVFAALFEELFSRGYMFAALADGIGKTGAVVVMSVIFGLLHIPNEGNTTMSIVMVTLAGVFLNVILLVTRSLYAAWLAHVAWNWVMAVPFHMVVSGEPLPMPGYKIVDNGPDWATGGAWGPEGGLLAGIAMLAGLAMLYRMHARSARAAASTITPAQ